MQRTMLIYDGYNDDNIIKIVKNMTLILGPAKYCCISEFKEEYKKYDFYVLISNFFKSQSENNMMEFIIKNAAWIVNKKIGLLCLDPNNDDGIRYLKNIRKILGNSVVHAQTIKDEIQSEKIINFSLELKRVKESFLKLLPKEQLEKKISQYLNSHNICCLATCSDNWVRTTLSEYVYNNGYIYILTEGGKKFANLLLNKRVSISLSDNYRSIDNLTGIQIRGKAEIISLYSDEYKKVLNMKNLTLNKVKSLPVLLNILKVKMDKVEFLNSNFKNMGYDTKQVYYFK